jgi:hypothetical protein
MKATLKRFTEGPPTEVHYKAAAKGLGCRRHEIPEFPHVRALAIWVDTVLWCAGDSHARNALFDRLQAKEARVVVDGELNTRRAVAESAGIGSDEARKYMDKLAKPRPTDEETVH